MSKPKYKQGKRIGSMAEFDECKSLWYKWCGKTRHRGFLESLQYHTLRNYISRGVLYAAELIDSQEESEVTQDSEVYYEYLDQVKRYIKYANDIQAAESEEK